MARVRRSAEEARRLILDAAEARLCAAGPAGLRLQDVARDVGVTHPAVLHHFGNREGLVDAVVARGLQRLQADLVEALSGASETPDAVAVLERVSAVLGDAGHARLLAWLLMSQPEGEAYGTEHTLGVIAQAVHAGREDIPLEEAQFVVLLAALTMFADAIAGPSMRRSLGLEEEHAARFRAWLGQLLGDRLGQG